MTGAEIRKTIIDNGLKLWEVADRYGVSDTTFSKMLRKDFNEENTRKVLSVVENLKRAEKKRKK